VSGLKRLVLMRHAKSSWSSGASDDHERPLNGRGRRDCPKVGAEVARLGWVPDVVLSSDASRTRETFARMRASLGYEGEVEFRRDLYIASVEEAAAALAGLPDRVETALILGHNPTSEELLSVLSGAQEAMKTACAALLAVEADAWPAAVAARGAWTLERVVRPREL